MITDIAKLGLQKIRSNGFHRGAKHLRRGAAMADSFYLKE
jgi:hypothetical protein